MTVSTIMHNIKPGIPKGNPNRFSHQRWLDETRHYRWVLRLIDNVKSMDLEDMLFNIIFGAYIVLSVVSIIGAICAIMGIHP